MPNTCPSLATAEAAEAEFVNGVKILMNFLFFESNCSQAEAFMNQGTTVLGMKQPSINKINMLLSNPLFPRTNLTFHGGVGRHMPYPPQE